MHESTNFSQILSDNKKTNTVTPQFYLFFRKDMPNTTKYSKCVSIFGVWSHLCYMIIQLRFILKKTHGHRYIILGQEKKCLGSGHRGGRF